MFFYAGEENFLKEAFLPPNPQPSRTFKRDYFFDLHSALDASNRYVRTAPTYESFCLPFFKKALNLI